MLQTRRATSPYPPTTTPELPDADVSYTAPHPGYTRTMPTASRLLPGTEYTPATSPSGVPAPSPSTPGPFSLPSHIPAAPRANTSTGLDPSPLPVTGCP